MRTRNIICMAMFGWILLIGLSLGNGKIFAKETQDKHLLQCETVTGAVLTVTEPSITTQTVISDVTDPQVAQPSEGETTDMDDSQSENVIDASLEEKSLQLGIGEQVKMPVKNCSGLKVTYQSKNKQVASVNKMGTIRGKKVGKVKIYAKISTKTLVLSAQVKKKPTSIKIKKPRISSVKIGTKISLKVTLNKSSASYKIRWSSSKKSVATVNTSGVLVVKGRGRTTITAKTYNGVAAKIVFALH